MSNDFIGLFKVGIIDTLDVLSLDELLDSSFLQSLFATFVSTYFYDDDDCADSEWEDNDSNVSNIQATILVANVMGMIPGLETSTSDASLTFFFSIGTMATLILIGFSLHNVRYFAILFPTGTPLVMTPFIILIEFVSYIARAVSLGMRLFANMFAGHSLVKILMSFAWLFLTSALPVLSIPVFALLLVIFLMELGIAYLQSYVFGALTAMYFEDVIALGH
jgi:ATP synthase subunit 6